MALSLWEVFTLFDHLNLHVAKSNMFRPADIANSVGSSNVLVHEPQRYHFAMWEHFYALINGSEASGLSYRESVEQKMNLKKKEIDVG